jgi:hypothetical protein
MNKLLKNNKINIFIVFLIAVLFFYKATKVYFVADDFFYLVNRNNFDLYSPFTYFFYQPITFLIYWINYFWAGQSASNYHFFTIILNGINL